MQNQNWYCDETWARNQISQKEYSNVIKSPVLYNDGGLCYICFSSFHLLLISLDARLQRECNAVHIYKSLILLELKVELKLDLFYNCFEVMYSFQQKISSFLVTLAIATFFILQISGFCTTWSVLEENSSFKMLGLTFSSKMDWGSSLSLLLKLPPRKLEL